MENQNIQIGSKVKGYFFDADKNFTGTVVKCVDGFYAGVKTSGNYYRDYDVVFDSPIVDRWGKSQTKFRFHHSELKLI